MGYCLSRTQVIRLPAYFRAQTHHLIPTKRRNLLRVIYFSFLRVLTTSRLCVKKHFIVNQTLKKLYFWILITVVDTTQFIFDFMINYRQATSSDAENLLKTRHDAVVNHKTDQYTAGLLNAWAPKVNEESIRMEAEALKNPDRMTLIAEDEDAQSKPVGLCTIGFSEGLLKQCYVLPEYNGKGIARELVRQVETTAKEKGLKSLKLSSSLIALNFYKKQGYKELNSYNYELDNGLQMPCIMMEKEL